MRKTSLALALSFALLSMHSQSSLAAPQSANSSANPTANQSSASGFWKGAISLPNAQTLAVEIQLKNEANAWKGSISIPAQNAKDMPLKEVQVQGTQVAFVIDGVPGNPRFVGELKNNAQLIEGSFTQGGQSMSFKLEKQAKTPESELEKAQADLRGFEADVEKIRQDWQVQGLAIAIVKGDQIIYSQGHGLRDVAQKMPMTADTLLPIGSATKAFTTAVLASLVEEGKLDWEKPVQSYLPRFKLQDQFASERMTALDLVTHRSGMPRHDLMWYGSSLTRAEMVERLQYLEPNKDFRTDFQYNNLMYLTAGYLSETISGKSWENLVQEKLFQNLGMKRASFSIAAMRKDANYSLPYREEKEGSVKQIPFRDIVNVGPAGSINASVNELAAWMQMHMNQGKYQGKQILSSNSISFLHQARSIIPNAGTRPELVNVGYAPGWFNDVYRGHLRVHHGGNIDGFTALVLMLPQSNIGIAVLANMNGTPVPDLIARVASDRLLGLEKRDWSGESLARKNAAKAQAEKAESAKLGTRKSNTKLSHANEDYVGEYSHPAYGMLKISHAAGQFSFELNSIKTPLTHWHYDVMNGARADDPTFENAKLQFTSAIDGEINQVAISLEPSVKPIVFTKQAEARLSDPAYLNQFLGNYSLEGNAGKANISLRGKTLFAELKGQPLYELTPIRGHRFAIKAANGFYVEFKFDPQGKVNGLEFDQPNGVFKAKRD